MCIMFVCVVESLLGPSLATYVANVDTEFTTYVHVHVHVHVHVYMYVCVSSIQHVAITSACIVRQVS